jgi:NAD(P)-dependent dehydrogenase (short-subunit alcohol dehydrogenase family)
MAATTSAEPSVPPGAVAVVVGGSRGIGFAIGKALGQSGLRVVLASRSGPDLGRAAGDLRTHGVEASWVAADVAKPGGAANLSEFVLGPNQRLPIVLVYAAGVFGPIGEMAKVPVDEWRSVIDTNLLGAFYVTRHLLSSMLRAGWGRIVYISSKAALGGPGGGTSAYAISKIALNRLMAEVAAEVAGRGVTANSIHPGDVKTDMWSDIRETARRAGEIGDGMSGWAKMVERTGGDPVTLGAQMVSWLVAHPEVNGEFLLPEAWYVLRQGGQR